MVTLGLHFSYIHCRSTASLSVNIQFILLFEDLKEHWCISTVTYAVTYGILNATSGRSLARETFLYYHTFKPYLPPITRINHIKLNKLLYEIMYHIKMLI